jgi:AraC-like DNA-binding protein
MLTVVGRYNWQSDEKSISDQDLFVHCSGRYRLIHLESFQTDRPFGAENYQLLYVADGRARFKIDGELKVLEKGNSVLYQPGDAQYYDYNLKDHPDIYWVHFSCRKDHEFLRNIGWGDEKVYHVGVHNSYIKLFDHIIQELQLKPPHCEEQLKLLIQQLLLQMGRNWVRDENMMGIYNKEVEEAIQLFNLASEEDFTIKQYSKDRGLNYYRFIDTFTQYVGISPRQYIINIRMTKAKDLLMNSLFQISEVATLTGYDNPLYFSRLFKKTWGLSPMEYKKQNLNKE